MPGGGSWAAAGCYGSPVEDAPDFRFSGVPGAVGNLTVGLDISDFSLSDDGTCSGIQLGDPYRFTLVRAVDEPQAAAQCASLGQAPGAGQISQDYPGFPADGWVCNPPPLP